jgi:hypothetical protein
MTERTPIGREERAGAMPLLAGDDVGTQYRPLGGLGHGDGHDDVGAPWHNGGGAGVPVHHQPSSAPARPELHQEVGGGAERHGVVKVNECLHHCPDVFRYLAHDVLLTPVPCSCALEGHALPHDQIARGQHRLLPRVYPGHIVVMGTHS